MLTQERLKQLLHYDPTTGKFTRLASTRIDRVGKEPGSHNTKGYVQIRLDGVLYVAHRLAWLYVNGCFPKNQLDHIDGNKSNNKLENLREATNKQNQENTPLQVNNTSGYRGVHFERNRKGLKKYSASVGHNGKQTRIGLFLTAEDAATAAKAARDSLFTHHKTSHAA
jgi:hypothetical protein